MIDKEGEHTNKVCKTKEEDLETKVQADMEVELVVDKEIILCKVIVIDMVQNPNRKHHVLSVGKVITLLLTVLIIVKWQKKVIAFDVVKKVI